MTTYSYRVVVRFRRSILNMKRGFRSLEEALEYTQNARAQRFHDREAVYVINEQTGERVAEAGQV
jgi:hypothetical protein